MPIWLEQVFPQPYWSGNPPPVPSGTLINVQKITASGTYTPTAGANTVSVVGIGGGGGGGGVAGAASSFGGGGGGASGCLNAYLFRTLTNTPWTVTIGTHGAGGTSGANAGGNGNTTTIVDSSSTTIMTAFGGAGGQPCTANTTLQVILPGGGNGPGTGGDILLLGDSGDTGITGGVSNSTLSGAGGSLPPYGVGGLPWSTTHNGTAGSGYGAGGSGACSVNGTNHAGGAGTDGVVIIWEYS